MILKSDNRHHYLKDYYWSDGRLCYWRDNANYSEKTKKKLEKRLKQETIIKHRVSNGDKI